MSPEAQQIAIAEARPDRIRCSIYEGNHFWEYKSGISGQWESCINNDPLNDLNAMHEAEKMLSDAQRVEYHYKLSDIEVGKFTWEATAASDHSTVPGEAVNLPGAFRVAP